MLAQPCGSLRDRYRLCSCSCWRKMLPLSQFSTRCWRSRPWGDASFYCRSQQQRHCELDRAGRTRDELQRSDLPERIQSWSQPQRHQPQRRVQASELSLSVRRPCCSGFLSHLPLFFLSFFFFLLFIDDLTLREFSRRFSQTKRTGNMTNVQLLRMENRFKTTGVSRISAQVRMIRIDRRFLEHWLRLD
jgi:hypothetical protein